MSGLYNEDEGGSWWRWGALGVALEISEVRSRGVAGFHPHTQREDSPSPPPLEKVIVTITQH